MITGIDAAEPRRLEQWGLLLGLHGVDPSFLPLELFRTFDCEVPVWQSDLRVDELQAVFERIGHLCMARQEA